MEGELTRELARGAEKGELRHNLILPIHVHVYNNRVNAANNLMCLGYTVNKPCVRESRYVRLISWTLWSGSEHYRIAMIS
jgi:hypothetical protein